MPASAGGVRRLGVAVLAAGSGASMLVPFLALPPFEMGLWVQAEPVTAGLHAVSAIVSVGLLLTLLGDRRATAAALRHPFVLLPALLGAWSLVMSPLVDVPVLSLFGTPELGEGTVWYLDLAMLTAGAMVVQRYRRIRHAVAWVALAAVTAVASLTVHTDAHWAWAPFWFYDYLAFYGVFIAAILWTHLRPESATSRLAIIGFAVAVVALSGNRTAIISIVAIAPAVWLVWWLLRRSAAAARRVAGAVAVALPLLVMTAVHLAGQQSHASSLWSRMLHLEVTRAAVLDKPSSLATGYGWGRYGDLVIAYLPLGQIDRFGHGGTEVDWDAARSHLHFHSHNYLTEALLSAGLVGLLLAWAIPAALPLFCRRRLIVEAATLSLMIAIVFSVWFQLPGSIPYMALAFAGLATPLRPIRLAPVIRQAVPVGLVAVALLQGTAAAIVMQVGAQASEAAHDNRRTSSLDPMPVTDCANFLPDYGRGGIHLATLYRSFVYELRRKSEAGRSLTDEDAARLANYFCAAERRLDLRHSTRLETAGLIVRSELAFLLRDQRIEAVTERHLANWDQRLDQFLDRAPRRTDMAVPYLSWLLDAGNDRGVLALSGRMLATNPDDPVGLWFSGAVLINRARTAADGLALMKRSLELGLDRIMPIDPTVKEQILSAP